MEIQGKAQEDVVVIIDGDTGFVRIETAPLESADTHLINRMMTEMYAGEEENCAPFQLFQPEELLNMYPCVG